MIGSYAKAMRKSVGRASKRGRRAVVDHAPGWAKTWLGPFATYADMLFLDHGIFRVAYLNKHALDEQAFRAAQPTPGQIKRLAEQGVKTIVNLRGERECGSYWLERDACARHGVQLETFVVRSRAAPTPAELHGARALFSRVEYPMLMHCKSGADRAGLMSVLYLHVHKGVPMVDAIKQLSLRFGHFRQADTGVLDCFFERYIADTATKPMPFFDWVDTVYDPTELKDSFKAGTWANRLVNGVLRRE